MPATLRSRSVLLALALQAASAAPTSDLVYRDEELGNFTTASCADAPSCGTAMSSYAGVSAFSNGAEQCTGSSCSSYGTYGSQYQCVELAQRFFAKKYGTTPIW